MQPESILHELTKRAPGKKGYRSWHDEPALGEYLILAGFQRRSDEFLVRKPGYSGSESKR